MSQYSALKLYEHAFKMTWDWRKWLPSDVYDYHSLVYKEVNAPVEVTNGNFTSIYIHYMWAIS